MDLTQGDSNCTLSVQQMRAPFEDRMRGSNMFRHENSPHHTGPATALVSREIKALPTSSLRTPRRFPRKVCARGQLCFARIMPNGRSDSAACPIQNVSLSGIAFEYDSPLKIGSLGTICYKAKSGQPIIIGCTIKQCRDMGGGRFSIGVHFDRKLSSEDDKPDRTNNGRDVGFVVRPRQLRNGDGQE
jgi:hypothetical protein